MLKRFTAIAAAVLTASFGLVAPADAAQPTAKKYSSCAKLLDKYPNGVAKNKKAQKRAVRQGFERPRVRKKVYRENRKRLDKDGNGVVCEQEISSEANSSVSELRCLSDFQANPWQVDPRCARYLNTGTAAARAQDWCDYAKTLWSSSLVSTYPDFCDRI